jgi:hypothetical protein
MQDKDSRGKSGDAAPDGFDDAVKKPSRPARSRAEQREERLAAALRDNLRRRKAGRTKNDNRKVEG